MQKTCLIAAHDPWLIQLFRIYTEECGFSVVQAFESQDVLPLALSSQPVLIMLQMDLPGSLRGLEIYHAIRSDTTLARTLLMVFSWPGNPDEIRDPYTHQLQDPITYDAFLDVLVKSGVNFPNGGYPTPNTQPGGSSGPNGRRKSRK